MILTDQGPWYRDSLIQASKTTFTFGLRICYVQHLIGFLQQHPKRTLFTPQISGTIHPLIHHLEATRIKSYLDQRKKPIQKLSNPSKNKEASVTGLVPYLSTRNPEGIPVIT